MSETLTAKPTYRCPHCGQKLSFLDGTIVKLVGRLHGEHFSCKTMIYIPARLGAYGAIVGEGVRLEDGAKVEFECINGACKRNLTSSGDSDMAEIIMVDQDGREYFVLFNKIYGRHATQVVDIQNRQLLQAYGKGAAASVGATDKDRNYFGS